MKRVLITAAGGEIANPIIKSLSLSNLDIEIHSCDINPISSGLYQVHKGHIVPRVTDISYFDEIKKIVTEENIDLIIPGSDLELIPLQKLKEEGINVVVSSQKVLELTRNKELTYDFFKQFDLPFVITVSKNVDYLLKEVGFPIIVKPVSGSRSAGVEILFDEESLKCKSWDGYIFQELLVDKNIKETPNRDHFFNGQTLKQEDEISAQVYISNEGKVISNFISRNVLKDGIPVKIDPIVNKEYEEIIVEMAEKLAEIGLIGPCNIQFKDTSKGLVAFEINSRFTGITGVRAQLGYNEVELAVKEHIFGYTPVKGDIQADTTKIVMRNYSETIISKDDLLESK